MNVVIYAAVTLDGYIARSDNDSNFLFGKAWNEYLSKAKSIGNVIMGSRTYEYIVDNKEYEFPISGCLNVIMTGRKIGKDSDRLLFTDNEPREVLELLRNRGFGSAFVAGGSMINTSFMKEGLVNEFYVNMVPLVVGSGIMLFSGAYSERKLRRLDVEKFPAGVVRLHYKVR